MTRIKFLFARGEPLIFLSHLDLVRLFIRALKRARLPVAYSRGFNPHPRLAFALPLPLGVLATNEPGEIYFTGPVDPEEFLEQMNRQFPAGFYLKHAFLAATEEPSLGRLVEAALYRAELRDLELCRDAFKRPVVLRVLKELLAKEELLVPRRGKKQRRGFKNVRPGIFKAHVTGSATGPLTLELFLKAGSRGGVSPFYLLEQLAKESGSALASGGCWKLSRQGLYSAEGKEIMPWPEGT